MSRYLNIPCFGLLVLLAATPTVAFVNPVVANLASRHREQPSAARAGGAEVAATAIPRPDPIATIPLDKPFPDGPTPVQLAAEQGPGPIVTIPLDKQYVPVVRKNKTVSYKTAYFGKVYLGSPQQHFTVVFDTGSGHVFLPSSTCVTETCAKHRRFDRHASATSVDLDHEGRAVRADAPERDQVAIAYGTGEVTGEFVRETLCLAKHPESEVPVDGESKDCVQLRVITATEMTPEPFNTFAFDGVLGLGLDSLSVDPEFSFFGQMAKLNKLQNAVFGYFLSRSDAVASEISFGGHDERRVASALEWAPVHKPELGFWQAPPVR